MASWHLITGEYPPRLGGVSGYTAQVAAALAAEGERVHVWCPPVGESALASPGVTVHRQGIGPRWRQLDQLGKGLDREPGPRRVLVQWVPHAFGCRSMNVPFCAWLAGRRAAAGDRVEVMVHEPFLAFREGSWRQDVAALVHRLMTVLLLRAVGKVWVSIPFWERCWRPYALGRRIPFQWLPVPSNVPVRADALGVAAIRSRHCKDCGPLLGHFGTVGQGITALLSPALVQLARQHPALKVLLLGLGGDVFRRELLRQYPGLAGRVEATGTLDAASLSAHVQACDVLLQPYPDGATSRRTSLMAGLSHGKAIVTNGGPLSEPLWQESGAVLLAPAESEGLAGGVSALLSDARRRESLGAAAKALYNRVFDLRHVVNALRSG